MSNLIFILFLILFFVLALAAKLITTCLHELGHAIPAILLTREKVTIFIGSFGDTSKSKKLTIGLLEIWFYSNPIYWIQGLCVPSAKDVSINKKIVFVAAGPLTSFLLAIIGIYFTFVYDLHGLIKYMSIIFLGSAILDVFISFIPMSKSIKVYDGNITYNDGSILKQLFKLKNSPEEYRHALDLYDKEQYKEAAILWEVVLKKATKNGDAYRYLISAYIRVREFKRAKELSDSFELLKKMRPDDIERAGYLYLSQGMYNQAIDYFDRSLKINPFATISLNNKGYTLIILERYFDAIPWLDKAIEIDSSFAYAYNNRGLAKIMTGELEGGLADVNYSLELDNNNAYGYRNLGIYYFYKNENQEALTQLKKAKEFDSTTYMIDEWINRVEQRL